VKPTPLPPPALGRPSILTPSALEALADARDACTKSPCGHTTRRRVPAWLHGLWSTGWPIHEANEVWRLPFRVELQLLSLWRGSFRQIETLANCSNMCTVFSTLARTIPLLCLRTVCGKFYWFFKQRRECCKPVHWNFLHRWEKSNEIFKKRWMMMVMTYLLTYLFICNN
jgi:hypothetical protein